VHRREDEWFYVLEGELTFWIDGRVIAAPAGSFVYGPRNIPHTLVVASPTARFLVVVEPAGFENFMRALARPAGSLSLPPVGTELPNPERLTEVAREYGSIFSVRQAFRSRPIHRRLRRAARDQSARATSGALRARSSARLLGAYKRT